MSAVNQQEVLASFKLLVCMANADGKLLDEERNSITEAFSEIQLPEGVTVESLLSEQVEVDELLTHITSDTAQELAYQSAFAMANIDGDCSPEEQELLEKNWCYLYDLASLG